MLSHNIIEASKKLRSEMEEKVKQCKAFGLIQRKIKRTMPVQEAFKRLDTNNNGYLVLRDFHINFSNFFDLSLRNHEVRNLFQEIDTDHNGILLFAELENFFKKDYVKEMKELEIQREQTNTQNEIFDHMIKILVQRGLSLQDVFNEIDTDKSGFIDVEEFHDLLERMGFTITQS
jgi:Ca2+-binding EF-hand superfamily protein